MSRSKVSVIGAGAVGATAAQRIADSGLADVALVDVVEGMPQGKALDMMQSAPALGGPARGIEGSNDIAAIKGSDVVVLTAGFPRKPGMSREELLQKNADIVGPLSQKVGQYAPDCIFVTVSNPLDIMTCLAWKRSGLDSNRVVGMAGVLDASRFAFFVAQELGVSSQDIRATVLGGHGDSMLLLPRYSTVSGIPVTELIPQERLAQIIERARNGGAEIVSLLKTGSAYYAPSASVFAMIEAILTGRSRILCASAYLKGEYGLKDIFIGVPVKLGAKGVEETIQLKLDEKEQAALEASADVIRQGIRQLGL